MEEYLEFEQIDSNTSPLDRVFDNKSSFRKEYRIQTEGNIDVSFKGKLYKVSNLSTAGFQILLKDIDDINSDTKLDFKLFFDNDEINGVCLVKYIEKIDLDLFAAGIKIESFLDKEQKQKYVRYVEKIRNKVLDEKTDA
ncbi:hypothetical protein JCM13304A_11580 [Desulfothermus okinawensis JCM 13304]